MDIEQQQQFREFHQDYRWDGVACMPYKEDGTAPFKAISRQVLFAEPSLGCELRYFEMAEGGYSTLERHEHMHAVMILRGHGQCPRLAILASSIAAIATRSVFGPGRAGRILTSDALSSANSIAAG